MKFGRLGSMGAGFGSDGVAPDLSNRSLITVLTDLNLTTGLKVCLDAGDADSYTSGDKFLDVSGNDEDFWLGIDGSTAGSKPTFTGSAGGLSSGEYWAHDGGDYFRLDTTNPTWVQNLHKDNAAFTIIAVIRPTGAAGGICGTLAVPATTTNIGVSLTVSAAAGGRVVLDVNNGSGTAQARTATAFVGATADVDQLIFVSVDEAAGTGFIGRNGTTSSFTSTYTSPSASDASFTLEIGARGNANTKLPNTARSHMFAAWEGVALTALQVGLIFERIRRRYGL